MKRRQQKGFALLVVVLIVALISVVAATLLDFLQVDLSITGQNRRAFDAQSVADGGAVELIDTLNTQGVLWTNCSLAAPNLKFGPLNPSGASAVNDPANKQIFSGDATLLKYITPADSTVRVTRAVVHEIRVTSLVGNGDATSEVRAEVLSYTTVPQGWKGPRWFGR